MTRISKDQLENKAIKYVIDGEWKELHVLNEKCINDQYSELLTLRKFREEAMEMAGFYGDRKNWDMDMIAASDIDFPEGPLEEDTDPEGGVKARALIEKWKVVK